MAESSSPLFPLPQPDPEEKLQVLYDRLAARFGLDPARIVLSRRKLTGGEIVYGRPHRITISAHLSLAEQHDTLRHEAAHAWAFGFAGADAGHGPLFRRLARRLGVSDRAAPETAALKEFRRRGARVVYRCEGCGRLFRRFRAFRGARDCAACLRAGRPARLRRVRDAGR
jgi:hypothetical protein